MSVPVVKIIPEIKTELIQSLATNFSLEPISLKNDDLIKISEE